MNAVPFYNVITVRYLHILQQSAADRLSKFHRKLLLTTSGFSQRRFALLNRRVVFICRLTHEYSRFWTPYLTTIILGFIVGICYLIIMVMRRLHTNLSGTVSHSMTIVNLTTALVIISTQCSKLVRNNQKIVSANRKICIQTCEAECKLRSTFKLKVCAKTYFNYSTTLFVQQMICLNRWNRFNCPLNCILMLFI